MNYLSVLRIIICICIPLLSSSIYAQKNIFKKFRIEKGGKYRKIQSYEPRFGNSGDILRYPNEEKITKPARVIRVDEETIAAVQESLIGINKITDSLNKEALIPKKRLSNGQICFLENGKWGMKNQENEIILDPQFDHIIVDTFSSGFVGYKGSFANYYDGKTGKPKFDEEYYWISAVDTSLFIIQSIDGFGMIKDSKVIIQSTMNSILKQGFKNSEKYFFKITTKDNGVYNLLDDLSTTFPVLGNEYELFEEHIIGDKNIYNLKNRKTLLSTRIFAYSIKLLDYKNKLILIGEPNESFLANFKGKLISKKGFRRIKEFKSNGIAVASILKKDGKETKYLTGLINRKGKWLVEPQFKEMSQLDDRNYKVWTNQKIKEIIDVSGQGIIDISGEWVIKPTYTCFQSLGNSRYLLGNRKDKKYDSNIFNLQTRLVEKEGLNANKIEKIKNSCNNNLQIMHSSKRRQTIVDNDLNPVSKSYRKIKVHNDLIVGWGNGSFDIYDCNGIEIPFQLDKKELNRCRGLKILNDSLFCILDKNRIGYIVNADGNTTKIGCSITYATPFGFKNLIGVSSSVYASNNSSLITQKGEIIIPCDFNQISNWFSDYGLFYFETKEYKSGLFFPDGKILKNYLFDNRIKKLKNGSLVVGIGTRYDRKYGLMTANGDFLLPIEYSTIGEYGGLVQAKKDEMWMLFDRMGKFLKFQ